MLILVFTLAVTGTCCWAISLLALLNWKWTLVAKTDRCLLFDSTFGGGVDFIFSGGHDYMTCEDCQVDGESWVVDFGVGIDHFNLASCHFDADLGLMLGDGNDLMTLQDCRMGTGCIVGIDGGRGYDRVEANAGTDFANRPRLRSIESFQ